MKTILGLLFAALVVNASVRLGDSVWRNYQFEDSINQEARFGDSRTAAMLKRKILQRAADHGVEVTDEDLVVERRGIATYVSVQYTEALELIPRAYVHEQVYDITMTVQPVQPLMDEKKK